MSSSQQRDFALGQLTISTEPDPLQVGSSALIKAQFSPAGELKTSCRLSWRQYMPGMEMKNDHVLYAMTETAEGEFAARGGDYSMGGEWLMEFSVSCGDKTAQVIFPFHLEWPE